MSERQKHGFVYQDEIIDRYSLEEETKYTAEWDAYIHGVPVSIKCSKYKTDVEYGDLFRNLNKSQDFLMFVGFHNEKNEIIAEHCLFIPHKEWQTFFSTEIAEEYRNLLNVITNERADDTFWTKSINGLRAKWYTIAGKVVVPRPKRDHQRQKRVQCATSYKNFIEVLLPRFGVNYDDWYNEIPRTET